MAGVAVLAMNPAVDTYLSVRQIMTGKKLRCRAMGKEAGGGGVNVARAMKRLGGDPVLLYPAGGDAMNLLSERLSAEGIDHRPMRIAGVTRENVTVLEEVTGDRLRLVLPGPHLEEPEWRRCLDAVAALDPAPGYLVASGSLPPGVPSDFYARIAFLCRERGIRMILDSSGEALRKGAEAGVYLLKPNVRELQKIIGGSAGDRTAQESAGAEIVARGMAEVLVLSLGQAGVLVVTAQWSRTFSAPIVPARSKTGAGDSLVAGMVTALADGKEIVDALMYGMACGASAVMSPGTELCSLAETERLYGTLAEKFVGGG